MKIRIIVAIILLALGMAYLVWLDYGCEYGGYMSWSGKKCVDFEKYGSRNN